ncbi:MAG TPA: alpha/beta hydrolase [Pseudorhodoplanes sp.]|nr:alpha/beta hydrolase [Pseudorhodoplanes sp.]
MKPNSHSLFVSAPDGLRLHVRICGAHRDGKQPVVCLPGLSRNGSDFEALAAALGNSRRVLSVDLRGRGLSEYDSNPANYSLPVELGDVTAILTALEAEPAVFVGTSRGGILTMLLAALRPGTIAGAVLNDIGPVIENKGVMRIKGYVGKLPRPRSIEEGAEILRRLSGAQFTRFTPDDWIAEARRLWRTEDGQLVLSYDPALSKTLQEADLERPLPALWAQFDALPEVPLMVIRGEYSDLLSADTVKAMKVRRPGLVLVEAQGEGHAPRLEGPLIDDIAALVARCDRAS